MRPRTSTSAGAMYNKMALRSENTLFKTTSTLSAAVTSSCEQLSKPSASPKRAQSPKREQKGKDQPVRRARKGGAFPIAYPRALAQPAQPVTDCFEWRPCGLGQTVRASPASKSAPESGLDVIALTRGSAASRHT